VGFCLGNLALTAILWKSCPVELKLKVVVLTFTVCDVSVEYKGHRLLDSAKQADVGHVKKQVSSELVNFKHPFSGDTALVCPIF